jgi:hypothetical protein
MGVPLPFHCFDARKKPSALSLYASGSVHSCADGNGKIIMAYVVATPLSNAGMEVIDEWEPTKPPA